MDKQTTRFPENGSASQQRIDQLSAELGGLLQLRGLVITTAESCTGGLVAGAITDVAGSSDWFERGAVTYSNEAKQALLGVDRAIFNAEGAVSEACVRAMAAGALQRAGADVAISVSGIAGPGGATPGKPVGTVWIGWALESTVRPDSDNAKVVLSPTRCVDAELFQFGGCRKRVREQAVLEALRGTISRINDAGIQRQ